MKIRFDIITIFPQMIEALASESILKRARENKLIDIRAHDLRLYSTDKHKKVDDRPFGGGPGMVMGAPAIFKAVKAIKGRRKARVILMCPTGIPFTQAKAKELLRERALIFICGHYEGIDERVRTHLVDESISIGDYVLTGGELPALIVADAVARLVPGVLGTHESLSDESFEGGLLEYPQYTRPANFLGIRVPDVLLSGHHKQVSEWRHAQSLAKTKKNRPDLIKNKKG